jgi:DNA end-binding protein Ku
MARVIARGVLTFGLVSIPVNIHSAFEDQSIHMHWLHKKCGSRVRNQLVCPVWWNETIWCASRGQ